MFFLGEIFVLEEQEIDCATGDTAVSEVEDGTEKSARVIHPRELIVKQREIEHIHDHSEHKGERSARSNGFRPYKTIEETIDDIAQSSGCNHCQAHQNSGGSVLFLRKTSYPPEKDDKQDDTENGEKDLAPESSKGHSEGHSFIKNKMELEPVTYNINSLTQSHIRLDQNLEGALIRIENKTYGVCRMTGKLIPKERLRLVPHATLTVEAKEMMNKNK